MVQQAGDVVALEPLSEERLARLPVRVRQVLEERLALSPDLDFGKCYRLCRSTPSIALKTVLKTELAIAGIAEEVQEPLSLDRLWALYDRAYEYASQLREQFKQAPPIPAVAPRPLPALADLLGWCSEAAGELGRVDSNAQNPRLELMLSRIRGGTQDPDRGECDGQDGVAALIDRRKAQPPRAHVRAAESYQWACSMRPDLVPPSGRRFTREIWTYICENECPAYGEGESAQDVPSFETWKRQARGGLRTPNSPRASPRAARTHGPSIVHQDEI